MPNPHHDEAGRFTSPPEQPQEGGPDWSSLGDYEYVQNAVNMARALENTNTRREALERIYNPQYDGAYLQPVQEQDEQPDEWAPIRQQFQPPEEEYYEPPPGLDPRQLPDILAPVLDQFGNRLKQEWMGELTQHAYAQALDDAAVAAVSAVGLPENFAGAVRYETEQITRQYTNRQPADVAKEVAGQMLGAIRQMQTAAVQPPAPGAPPPADAPVPGEPTPKTWDDANAAWEAAARAQQGG